MKVYFSLALIFLFSVCLGCFRPRSSMVIQPGNIAAEKPLNPDPYTWNFSQAKEGQVLKHAFILKNDSPKIITIKSINTSCGCTVSNIGKKRLAPQESTALKVAFDSKGYQGKIEQYVYVHTDNLDNPILRYIIKAEVNK